jgi:hypothetical protein
MGLVLLDRRVLGAIAFVDAATGSQVTAPLTLRSDRLGFLHNRSGLWVVNRLRAETPDEVALAAHLRAFAAPPATPVTGAVGFSIAVEDAGGRYMPRVVRLALPRPVDEIATPVEALLWPSPRAPLGPNWASLRASLRHREDGEDLPLAGARLSVLRRSDGGVLAQGFSDTRGEVLVAVPGLPVIDFTTPVEDDDDDDDDPPPPVGTSQVPVRLEVHTAETMAFPPDPDAIAADPQLWVPVADPMPEPELGTGRHVAGLVLTLRPQI